MAVFPAGMTLIGMSLPGLLLLLQ